MAKWTCWMLVMLAAMGCGKAPPQEQAPRPRAVTFSPALTELAFSMGLGKHVVGVTTQDLLPAGESRPIVGDLITVNTEAVLATRPDVLLVQTDVRNFEAVRRLAPSVRVEHFDIETLGAIGAAMVRLGAILGDEAAGARARQAFEAKLAAVRERVAGRARPAVLFVLWLGSPATGGRDSFVHEMIVMAGGRDLAEGFPRWRNLSMESILAMQPEVLICWTMPGSETQAKASFDALKRLGNKQPRMYFVSDRFWTIPTGRTADLVAEMATMIHPELAGATTRESATRAASRP